MAYSVNNICVIDFNCATGGSRQAFAIALKIRQRKKPSDSAILTALLCPSSFQ